MHLSPSELILNPDGTIYHLQLLPTEIATIIITVGDPDRVDQITSHFDSIEFTKQKREFKTATGSYKGVRITIISTGIGTDNIDIVINELDALANIDFQTRRVREEKKQLTIIRIGTSGAIQPEIPVDSFLISKKALGLDALLHFYKSEAIQEPSFQDAFKKHMNWSPLKSDPYCISVNLELFQHFDEPSIFSGVTATNIGFYGPQNRKLRLESSDTEMNQKMKTFCFRESKITNLEMETSGIYGLSLLLGHRAISLNAILANRATETFSPNPTATVDRLIQWTLEKVRRIQ